jgi:site-specific DNA recombinase
MTRKLLAASYVRMSKDSQETSPGQQREAIEKLAEDRGYEIVARYEDLGVSGNATDKRTGFRQMIADGSLRKFDFILCWDQDRFGRFDLIEAGRWIEPLRNAGVTLVTVTDGVVDWTTLTGQLGYMAKQMGKAQYLRDLSANVRRGQDKVERDGKWTRGFPPFGYEADPATGKLIPGDPTEVRLLRQIFEQYANGKSQREICVWLNAQKVKTKRGNDWQPQSIRHTLKNIVYRGHLCYGKSSASKYLDHGTPDGRRRDRPESDWRVLHNTHEPLVREELFNAVQERRKENRTMTGPKSKNRFPLSGMIYCANCGSRMVGSTGANGHKYYICCDYNNGKTTCQRRTVQEPPLLREVVRQIRVQFIDKFFGPEDVKVLRETMREILLGNQDAAEQSRRNNQQRLAKLEGELEQAVNALLATSEDLRPLVEKRVRQMQDDVDKAKDALATTSEPATEQIARAEQRIESAIGWLKRLEDAVDTDFDPVAMAELLRQFVERIDVEIERIPQGKRTSYRLAGGKIYFRAESFPAWAIPGGEKLANPPQRTCQVFASNNCIVIHFQTAA